MSTLSPGRPSARRHDRRAVVVPLGATAHRQRAPPLLVCTAMLAAPRHRRATRPTSGRPLRFLTDCRRGATPGGAVVGGASWDIRQWSRGDRFTPAPAAHDLADVPRHLEGRALVGSAHAVATAATARRRGAMASRSARSGVDRGAGGLRLSLRLMPRRPGRRRREAWCSPLDPWSSATTTDGASRDRWVGEHTTGGSTTSRGPTTRRRGHRTGRSTPPRATGRASSSPAAPAEPSGGPRTLDHVRPGRAPVAITRQDHLRTRWVSPTWQVRLTLLRKDGTKAA